MKLPRFSRASSFAVAVAVASLLAFGTIHLAHAATSTWDAGGVLDTNIGNNVNWDLDVLPNLTDSANTVLTFGTAGAAAAINTDVNIKGIIINKAANFNINSGAGTLTIGTSGIAVSIPSNSARTHTINSNVVLSANQLWTVGLELDSGSGSRLTAAGIISDAGQGYMLSVDGGSIVKLTGSNTYTGGTTVLNCTLELVNLTNTLADAGAVHVSGGTLEIFNNTDTVGSVLLSSGNIQATGASSGGIITSSSYDVRAGEVSAKLAGTASLTKSQATGVVTLYAATTYTEGTNISAGKLQLGNNDILLNAGAVTINGDTSILSIQNFSDTVGVVTLQNSGRITGGTGTLSGSSYDFRSGSVSAILGGSGALTQTTDGIVTLSNANTYTGNTTVSAGTLIIGNANAIPNGAGKGNVILEGTLDLNDVGANINGLSGNGTVTNNTYDGGEGTTVRSLSTGGNDQSSTFSGTISDGYDENNKLAALVGLTKVGSGTFTLTGNNTYSGGTTVSAGTLTVNNTSGSGTGSGLVTIAAGATLKGSGTLGGNVIVNGTHSPGNSPGIETVTGDLTYGATSIFDWELSTNSQTQTDGTITPYIFDQVIVGGNLAINSLAQFNILLKPTGSDVLFSDNFWDRTHQW